MKQLNANDLLQARSYLYELLHRIDNIRLGALTNIEFAHIPSKPGTVYDLVLELLAFGELDANVQVIAKERPYDVSYAFIAGEPGQVEAIYIALGER